MNHARSILPGPRRSVGLSLVLVALLTSATPTGIERWPHLHFHKGG